MMDFRARRKEAASAGQMDEGIDWVAEVDGGLFRPRSSRKRGRCQLRTVLGDVEFADDTVTCSAASSAPAVEQLFDDALRDWRQRRNAVRRNISWLSLMHPVTVCRLVFLRRIA